MTSRTFSARFGEKHRCLPGRVAAAGDNHRRAAAELGFPPRGRVVNPAAFELLASLGLQPAVLGARRDDDALGAQGRVAALDLQAGAVTPPP